MRDWRRGPVTVVYSHRRAGVKRPQQRGSADGRGGRAAGILEAEGSAGEGGNGTRSWPE